MRKVLVFTISIISLFLGSCSNDLEINAPWKDVTVVFGLLNIDSTTHYVRISKAFLGEGDALEFASQFDSIYYKPELLDVKVYRVYNDEVKDSFLCSESLLLRLLVMPTYSTVLVMFVIIYTK